MQGADGGAGIGLVEIYDLDQSKPKLKLNIPALSSSEVSAFPKMKKSVGFLVFPVLFSLGFIANATTVIPPKFDELVSRAQVIFEGEVTGLQSQWIGEGAQHRIVTFVTFKVSDALKGDPGTTYSMRMLGGTVDGRTMEVTDAPKFKVGDRDILFVENNGSQFIPLVGISTGGSGSRKTKPVATLWSLVQASRWPMSTSSAAARSDCQNQGRSLPQ